MLFPAGLFLPWKVLPSGRWSECGFDLLSDEHDSRLPFAGALADAETHPAGCHPDPEQPPAEDRIKVPVRAGEKISEVSCREKCGGV